MLKGPSSVKGFAPYLAMKAIVAVIFSLFLVVSAEVCVRLVKEILHADPVTNSACPLLVETESVVACGPSCSGVRPTVTSTTTVYTKKLVAPSCPTSPPNVKRAAEDSEV